MLVGRKKSASSLPESVREVLPIAHGHCLSLWMGWGSGQRPLFQVVIRLRTQEIRSLFLPCSSSTLGLSGCSEDLGGGIGGDELRQPPDCPHFQWPHTFPTYWRVCRSEEKR